jgi:hypothetical protein
MKKTMKVYIKETMNSEEFKHDKGKKKKKKKKKGDHHGGGMELDSDDDRFLEEELKKINTPYCNFSIKYNTILYY